MASTQYTIYTLDSNEVIRFEPIVVTIEQENDDFINMLAQSIDNTENMGVQQIDKKTITLIQLPWSPE